jgi:hypothetical protein
MQRLLPAALTWKVKQIHKLLLTQLAQLEAGFHYFRRFFVA